MALNSINTNISAYYAQQNIGKASSSASLSVARLSSGNRIIRASDDVASLAAGTSLRTQVTTLKTALINTAQGSSLLQVADGALSQIIDILQRQKSIAVQSGAGTLDSTARGFLNQEFQQLSSEINRLAGTTNFNGVTLLDGSVFDKVTTNTVATSAGQATATINFLSTLPTAKSITFNGVAFTATIAAGATGNNFSAVPASGISGMVDSLVQRLNASTDTRVSGATYSRSGNALVITQDAGGGAVGRSYLLDATGLGASSVNTTIVASTTTIATGNIFFLQGGTDIGLGFGRTTGSGVVGDNLLTVQNQIKANQQITIPPIAGGANVISTSFVGKAITFNVGGLVSFNFITSGTTPVNVTDIVVGSTIEETLDNAVQTLRAYGNLASSTVATATGAPTNERKYAFQQFEFDRSGRQINIERLAVGNVLSAAVAPLALSVGINVAGSGPGVGTGNFSNGSTTGGIGTIGVNNAAFTGKISGFTASYTGTSDTVNLSITVGGIQYQAFNVNTNVLANTDVRFNSVNGGYFDVQFAANNGLTVIDQAGANTIAARLDAAFAGMNFYQKRDVSSYTGAGAILTNGVSTGSLTGTSVRFQTNDFSDLNITSINVQAPASGSANGIIEFVVNGETYRSADIGTVIRPNSRVILTSLTDSSKQIEFFGPAVTTNNAVVNNPALAIDFSTSDRAASFEDALKAAFGFDAGGSALQFQVGTTTTDTLSVSIGSVTTDKLYGGVSVDVLTQASSAAASAAIETAIDNATSVRADVGALQSRFGYASNNIESSLQNQDAARGVLLDTDIASESTAYATAQVQLQAGIAVLAQANLLPQNLLKLIG